MNRALPPGDRGHRSGAAGGQSRCRRVVPGACGLVGGAAILQDEKRRRDRSPAARLNGSVNDQALTE